MGIHQDIQKKVVQELYDIFGDSDRPVTFQDTLDMKYLERCIMETLRLYPPVPVVARKMNQELKLGTKNKLYPYSNEIILHRQSVNPTEPVISLHILTNSFNYEALSTK